MADKEHICMTCKHHAKWDDGIDYCFEDGDQVALSKRRMERDFCCLWKDEDDKTPDIQWD